MNWIYDNQRIRKVFVYAPNWVGDHVMAFPFYLTLRELFPRASLVLCGRNWISSLYPSGVFEEIVTLDRAKNLSQTKLNELKNQKIDLAFTLSPSFRSALLLYQIQSEYRIGYPGQFRKLLLRLPPKMGGRRIPAYNNTEHRALSYLRLLTPWFDNSMTGEDYLQLFRGPLKNKNLVSLSAETISIKPKSLVICPGSVAESKIWPIDYVLQIIQIALAKDSPFKNVVLVGSKIEAPFASYLIDTLEPALQKRVQNLTTKTDLSQLVDIIEKSSAVLANDSGISHLTSLTTTGLVSFQGMGRKEETLPLNARKIVHHAHLPCSPCMKKKCPRTDKPLECLTSILPAQVWESLKEISR
ncbi:MAG: glycosyltransferase family 9 protein [Leptospiraceae bacterium]|nr:glycosyltransferase family 9 protein [Leptospiraceae bacterium]